jgi:hypothetical protein
MASLKVGQKWEIFHPGEKSWRPAVVEKIDGDQVVFRYEGLLELVTVGAADLQSQPDQYRPIEDVEGA